MRKITIDFNSQAAPQIAGYMGEHNATEITVIKPDGLWGAKYSIAFLTNGKVIHSKFFASDEEITVGLWQQLTQDHVLFVQLEAYDENGDYIGKSAVAKLVLLNSVRGGAEVDADTENSDIISAVLSNTDFRKKLEDNVDTLDKLSVSDAGTLLFDGDEIIGGGGGGVYVGTDDMPSGYNVQIDPSGEAAVVPTKTSELENDSGFITEKEIEGVLTDFDNIPDYWQAALDEGVEAINTAMMTAGYNKSAFLFYSDVHWNYGSQMSPKLLKYLYQHTAMTKANFGGDIVNDEATDYDTMEYLWDWRNQLKDLPNHHSVVGNHDDGNVTNYLFSEQYVYGYLLAAEETPDTVRGDSGLYYYIDHSPEKTRYLYLDTAYKGMNDNQQAFVKEALLSTPEGWHIVAIAHSWYEIDYDQYSTRPVPVKGLNSNASIAISMFDNYNSRVGDFAECGGWVEFCIGGHIHYDYDAVTNTGIPIILVETDSKHTRGNYAYTEGTTSEASVNGIIADYDNHKIYVVRIGRGESREIEVTNYVVTYTNILTLSDIGYQADREISTTSYEERDSSSGYDLTGYIPLTSGDVFRLRGVTMPDGATDRSNMIYMFNSDKSWRGSFHCTSDDSDGSLWNPVFEGGNLVQFTIPAGYTGEYIRINAKEITASSVITINELIE